MATNTKQSSTISTQYTTILALLYEVKQFQIRIINKGGIGVIGGKSNDVRKCLKDGYCWSHGYKVSLMIPECKNKKEGHKEKATSGNTTKFIPFN